MGLTQNFNKKKRLFHTSEEKIIEEQPKFISPYLIGLDESSPIVVEANKPLNNLPKIIMGSGPIDNGNYILTNAEKAEFLLKEPGAEAYLRPYINAKDYLNNKQRWIFALHNISPKNLKMLPETLKRVDAVRKFRLKSRRHATRKIAETPLQYDLNVLPSEPFLLVPRVSSERRKYVPIGYVKPPVIPSDATMIIQNANLGLFALLTSYMHMVWLRKIGGKLHARLRYSAGMVYNTFPVPDKKLDVLKKYAQKILDERAKHTESSLADLYDPVSMPNDLYAAHSRLDMAVERLYRKEPFTSDAERLEFLLTEYQKMVGKNTTLLHAP